MGILRNTKHERFAQAVFNGATADEAYVAAGYHPHRGNASRLRSNEHIMRRIAELTKAKAEKTVHLATVDVLEEMHKLRGIVDMAIAAGDLVTAARTQSYVMRLFGFEDSPTLAHEMLGSRKVKHTAPAEGATTQPAAPAPHNGNALSGALEQLMKARAKLQSRQ